MWRSLLTSLRRNKSPRRRRGQETGKVKTEGGRGGQWSGASLSCEWLGSCSSGPSVMGAEVEDEVSCLLLKLTLKSAFLLSAIITGFYSLLTGSCHGLFLIGCSLSWSRCSQLLYTHSL